jgi:hypothetical protein
MNFKSGKNLFAEAEKGKNVKELNYDGDKNFEFTLQQEAKMRDYYYIVHA